MPKYIDPDVQGIHPLRLELSERDLERIAQAIENDDADSVSLEELAAVQDIMFDHFSANNQTHPGYRTLQ